MLIYEVLMAFLGNTIYSSGVIFQKKGSVWMSWRDKKDRRFALMFALWSVGVLFSYVFSALPIGIASKKLPPQTISAMSGWNIAAVVLLSALFLKERLRIKNIIYTLIIIASIIFVNMYGIGVTGSPERPYSLYILMAVPFLLLIPILLKLVKAHTKVAIFSVFSGMMGGLTLVLMNLMVKENGMSIIDLVTSQYLIIYFGAGAASAAALQSAYRIGEIKLITPLQTSVSIIYPLICAYFLFDHGITVVQTISAVIIVISCLGLLQENGGNGTKYKNLHDKT